MSIPTLCQACDKHYRSTVVKACPFCDDVQFPEQVLCDLVREGHSEQQPFRCAAFRPALSVVQHGHTEARPMEEGNEDPANMSPKDKWFQTYAVQQLSLHGCDRAIPTKGDSRPARIRLLARGSFS
jgi:hypothetical protein